VFGAGIAPGLTRQGFQAGKARAKVRPLPILDALTAGSGRELSVACAGNPAV
jgi:hypothetical protein